MTISLRRAVRGMMIDEYNQHGKRALHCVCMSRGSYVSTHVMHRVGDHVGFSWDQILVIKQSGVGRNAIRSKGAPGIGYHNY